MTEAVAETSLSSRVDPQRERLQMSMQASRASSLLVLFAMALFVAFALVAAAYGLDKSDPTNRARFHAIPVALSQLYHGHQHDYTAIRPIAQSFQGPTPLRDLLNQWIFTRVETSGAPYLWMADDRGLSDLIYIGFALFGPSMFSIYLAYLLILGLSLLFYINALWRDKFAMFILNIGILALIVGLPLFVRAPGTNFGELSVHISETRLIEFLALIPTLFLLVSISGAVRITRVWVISAIVQCLILAFCLHIRSSIGWLFVGLCVVAVGFGCAALFLKVGRRYLPTALATVVVVVGAYGAVRAYHQAVFHPAYLGEEGPRTVWHNILMGLSHSPTFATFTGVTGVDDASAVRAVLRRMQEKSDPRLGETWTEVSILGSLGGWTEFTEWRTYDSVAREMVLDVVGRYPRSAIKLVIYEKPKLILASLGCQAMLLTCGPLAASFPAIRLSFFSVAYLLPLGLIVYTFWRSGEVSRASVPIASLFVASLVLLGFSTVPSIVFYPALTTLGGFVLLLTLLFYLSISIVLFRFLSPSYGDGLTFSLYLKIGRSRRSEGGLRPTDAN